MQILSLSNFAYPAEPQLHASTLEALKAESAAGAP
jgi:hypothetical protein